MYFLHTNTHVNGNILLARRINEKFAFYRKITILLSKKTTLKLIEFT